MARNFTELQAKMTPESRIRVKERVGQAVKEIALTDNTRTLQEKGGPPTTRFRSSDHRGR